MERQKITLEYPFKNTPVNVLWNSVSSPLELSEWFADKVLVNNDTIYTFKWNNHEQTANLLKKSQSRKIRFQWEEDENTPYFFEMQVIKMELSNDVSLLITDFSEEGEIHDAELLWNQQIDQLRRRLGA